MQERKMQVRRMQSRRMQVSQMQLQLQLRRRWTEVTSFNVGPDIHLEYQGRFYLPDIQPENLKCVFKNFKPSQLHFSFCN